MSEHLTKRSWSEQMRRRQASRLPYEQLIGTMGTRFPSRSQQSKQEATKCQRPSQSPSHSPNPNILGY